MYFHKSVFEKEPSKSFFKVKNLSKHIPLSPIFELKNKAGNIWGYRFRSLFTDEYWIDVPAENMCSMLTNSHLPFTLDSSGFEKSSGKYQWNSKCRGLNSLIVDENLDNDMDDEHLSIVFDGGFLKWKIKNKSLVFTNVKNLEKIFYSTDFTSRFLVLSSEMPIFHNDICAIHFYSTFDKKAFSEKEVKDSMVKWISQFGKNILVEVKATEKMFHYAIYADSDTIWNEELLSSLPTANINTGNVITRKETDSWDYIKSQDSVVQIPKWNMFESFSELKGVAKKDSSCKLMKYSFPMIIVNEDSERLALVNKTNMGNYLSLHAKPIINDFNTLFSNMDLLTEILVPSLYTLPSFSCNKKLKTYCVSRKFPVSFDDIPFSKEDVYNVLTELFVNAVEDNKDYWKGQWIETNSDISTIESVVELGEDFLEFIIRVKK